jgi:hypothetical protein
VVVQIINVEGIVVRKSEDHTPVRADRYRPKSFHLTLERMQPESRHIHIGDRAGRVQTRKNVAQSDEVFSDYAAMVVVFVKPVQPLVTNRPDRSIP